MADYSSAQRYSMSKPVPVSSTPEVYGAQYPPQPQPMPVNPVMALAWHQVWHLEWLWLNPQQLW